MSKHRPVGMTPKHDIPEEFRVLCFWVLRKCVNFAKDMGRALYRWVRADDFWVALVCVFMVEAMIWLFSTYGGGKR